MTPDGYGNLTIAIDFDDCYSVAPAMWDAIILIWKSFGHKVICVTCRFETAENFVECDIPGVLTYFTSHSPKRWYMREKKGVEVDIWVDDNVESIIHGR